ncbi:MAG TPA: hypothetical protein VMB19_10060 [Silvibacterium sp.]|nr:hypothetical protein [Silvibacterium sp.]
MKKKIMAESAESTRQFGLDRGHASFELVDLSTIAAQEVMVVFFPRKFIAGRLTRQLDRNQPAIFNHRLEVAINSSDAEVGDCPLCIGEDLFRREGPVGLDKGGTNSVFLAGISRCDRVL